MAAAEAAAIAQRASSRSSFEQLQLPAGTFRFPCAGWAFGAGLRRAPPLAAAACKSVAALVGQARHGLPCGGWKATRHPQAAASHAHPHAPPTGCCFTRASARAAHRLLLHTRIRTRRPPAGAWAGSGGPSGHHHLAPAASGSGHIAPGASGGLDALLGPAASGALLSPNQGQSPAAAVRAPSHHAAAAPPPHLPAVSEAATEPPSRSASILADPPAENPKPGLAGAQLPAAVVLSSALFGAPATAAVTSAAATAPAAEAGATAVAVAPLAGPEGGVLAVAVTAVPPAEGVAALPPDAAGGFGDAAAQAATGVRARRARNRNLGRHYMP